MKPGVSLHPSRLWVAMALLAATLALAILPGIAAAQGEEPVLYACNGGSADSAADGGAIMIIDQTTGMGTVIGTPLAGWGLTGIDFDSAGRLFGATSSYESDNARLIEIDPDTGSLLDYVGDLLYEGEPVDLTDLAFQPGTNALYGVTGRGALDYQSLVTIDTGTAAVSLVGLDPTLHEEAGLNWLSLAFAPDGTLYVKETNSGGLWTLDPSDAEVLTSTTIDPDWVGGLGLAVRPTDGLLLLSECCDDTRGNDIYVLDAATGEATLLGAAGYDRRVHDLAFRWQPAPVGGLNVPVSDRPAALMDSAALLVIALALGAGLRVISRRRPAG